MIESILEIATPFIALLFTYLFIDKTALIDAEHYKKNQYVNDHSSRFAQRAFVALILLPISWNISLGFGLLFWGLFDAMLNTKRGYNVWYLGTDDPIDAKSDDFFRNKPILYKITKYISIILGVFLYFI